MRSDDPRFRVLRVDGQQVLCPDEVAWRELENGASLDGLGVIEEDYRRWYFWTREFVDGHRELSFALYRPGRSRWWSGIVLVDLGGTLQRIHLERLACESCGWIGMSGNPWVVDLYFGSPEEKAARRRAYGLELVGCPICGGKLPRPSVWTEPLRSRSGQPLSEVVVQRRVKIGDVVEIMTAKGRAYAQVSHIKKLRGYAVRVLPGFFDDRPEDFSEIVDKKESFVAFFPVQNAVSQGTVEIVAHEDVPARAVPGLQDARSEIIGETQLIERIEKEWRSENHSQE